MSLPVLLLRTPTSTPDRYESALLDASFQPFSLPVLETVLEISKLKDLISSGPTASAVGGVIVTSARSAEAWGKAVDEVLNEGGVDTSRWPLDWSQTPFYTVGPATAAILSSLASQPGESAPSSSSVDTVRVRLCPSDIRGTDSGTAERLARFIVQDTADRNVQLLYLTGDKNKDTLPRILSEESGERISLVEVQVYATQGVDLEAFERDLLTALSAVKSTAYWWVVFFAPSSAAHALPIIQKHLLSPHPETHIAAIGPTTEEFPRAERGLRVDAVPAKPSAEALVASLRAAG